ncbi:MAG: putative peptidoglycan glycosyltransferase FtsW [Patescibacteria group bacterium]
MKYLRMPKHTSAPDYVFIALLFVIVVFGIVMLTSASSDLGQARFGYSYYYVTHQLINGLLVGIVGFIAGSLIYYRRFEKWSLPILGLSVILLILVFTPLGSSVNTGSDRWLTLGPITFQPGEILKLTFFIYITAWMSKKYSRNKSFFEGFLPFFLITGVVIALLFFQPATTIALLIFTAAVLTYFTAGAPLKYLVVLGIIAAVAVSLLIYLTPYRLQRIKTFLNPGADQLNSGYHINQALMAIGSGGLTGVGFGKSTSKLSYLPEPIGDSVFAIIAEELGFIGAISFILVFLLFIWRGMQIARNAPDNFGRLLVTGFMCVLGLQAFVHIAAISGILPLTGMPLPFVSYGGTALAVFLTMSGIIVSVSRYRR